MPCSLPTRGHLFVYLAFGGKPQPRLDWPALILRHPASRWGALPFQAWFTNTLRTQRIEECRLEIDLKKKYFEKLWWSWNSLHRVNVEIGAAIIFMIFFNPQLFTRVEINVHSKDFEVLWPIFSEFSEVLSILTRITSWLLPSFPSSTFFDQISTLPMQWENNFQPFSSNFIPFSFHNFAKERKW